MILARLPLILPAAIFFTNALLYVTLFSRLPEVTAAQGISAAVLGFALLAQTCGALLGFPFAARAINRFGARRVAGATLFISTLCLPAAASGILAPGGWGMAIALSGYGFAMAIMEVAKNLVAARVEERSGKNVISKSHGFWSAGLFIGALLGGRAASANLSATQELIFLGLVACPLVVFLLLRAGDREPMGPVVGAGPTGRFAKFRPPDAFVMGLLVLFSGFSVTEGVVYDWSMFYLKHDIDMDALAAARIYACFTVGMFTARMIGDTLRKHFTTRVLIRGMAGVTLVGITFATLGPRFDLGFAGLLVGFTLIGAGVALAAPVAISLAMRHPTRPVAQTMASYSLISMLALFAIPPLLGVIVETHGAIWTILFASPLLLFVAIFAKQIVKRMERATQVQAHGSSGCLSVRASNRS